MNAFEYSPIPTYVTVRKLFQLLMVAKVRGWKQEVQL